MPVTYTGSSLLGPPTFATTSSWNITHTITYSSSTSFDYYNYPLYGSGTGNTPWGTGPYTYSYPVLATEVYSIPLPPLPPISQEEADRRLQETRQRQMKNAIVRQRAVKKGRRLLISMLDDVQRFEYSRTRGFTVVSHDGRIFRLRKRGTVHEMDHTGKVIFSHCIHLPSSYIEEDSLIALKLLIENDVAKFDEIANTSPLHSVAPIDLSAARAAAALRPDGSVAGSFAALSEAVQRFVGADEIAVAA